MTSVSSLKSRPASGRPAAGATTASVQDYLAGIYDLAGSGGPVIGARLADTSRSRRRP